MQGKCTLPITVLSLCSTHCLNFMTPEDPQRCESFSNFLFLMACNGLWRIFVESLISQDVRNAFILVTPGLQVSEMKSSEIKYIPVTQAGGMIPTLVLLLSSSITCRDSLSFLHYEAVLCPHLIMLYSLERKHCAQSKLRRGVKSVSLKVKILRVNGKGYTFVTINARCSNNSH